jgi:hypothetical protein
MIDIKCPGCGKAFRFKDGVNVQALAGKKIKCPACAAVLDIPGRVGTPTPAAETPSPQQADRILGGMAATADEWTGAMTTEERLAALEREQAETKAKPAQLEKALEGQSQEVRSRGFVLVDESGNTRAELVVDKDVPGLILCDENGTIRVALVVGKDGPVLNLFDESGERRASLAAGKIGPVLNLLDDNGEQRALLCVSKEGPSLDLADENGERRALLCENKNGPWLCLYDGNGKRRAALEVIKDGPLLVLCNEKERGIWEAP